MTVIVTIHDVMLGLRPNEAGGRHLRQNLWAIFGKICCQGSINGPDLGGMIEFKFKRRYKLQRAAQQTTLGNFRIELLHAQRSMNLDPFDLLKSKALFEHLAKPLRDLWSSTMTTLEEAMNIGKMTTEEATQAITVGDALERVGIVVEIPKSLCTERLKKDK